MTNGLKGLDKGPDDFDTDYYDPLGAAHEFKHAFGITPFIEEPDGLGRRQCVDLRMRLIAEEWKELADELLDVRQGHGNMAKTAKEMADLLYVIYQAAAVLEIPIYEVYDAVHASNMSKLDDEGNPIRRSDGKVLKGPNYFEPDIEAILHTYGVSRPEE